MHHIQDDPSLHRLELLGNLARACRLALQEHDKADAVTLTVNASLEGLQVDVMFTDRGVPVGGWGQ